MAPAIRRTSCSCRLVPDHQGEGHGTAYEGRVGADGYVGGNSLFCRDAGSSHDGKLCCDKSSSRQLTAFFTRPCTVTVPPWLPNAGGAALADRTRGLR